MKTPFGRQGVAPLGRCEQCKTALVRGKLSIPGTSGHSRYCPHCDELAGQQFMIRTIAKYRAGLTDWELEFVIACAARLERLDLLTPKQLPVAKKLYARVSRG